MKRITLILALFLSSSFLDAAWVVQGGKLTNASKVATLSCEGHYKIAYDAFEAEDYRLAQTNFSIVALNFPNSPFGADSAFFDGVCCYQLGEYDMANEAFNTYLKASSQPKYFQDAMEYKYLIANSFACGAKRRPFGAKQLPKWLPGESLALQIYDQIIQAIPCHEYAAQSLWTKGNMLWSECAYQESIESFQQLIRRFPKHELTPQAYLAINQVFLTEAQWEFQNPDLLQLAEINLKKFRQEFPRDERVVEAEKDLLALKETYALGLWKTAQFYEWKGETSAASIYYMNAIHQFPETNIAERCQRRLNSINNGNS